MSFHHVSILVRLLSGLPLCFVASARSDGATVLNGSFESGNLDGWISGGYSDFFYQPAVRGGGQRPQFADFFMTVPTQGEYVFSHVFDSDGGAAPWLGQTIGVILPGETLSFDYRIGYDFSQGATASMQRSFVIRLVDVDSGDVLGGEEVYRTSFSPRTLLDSGPLSHSVDLDPFAGRNARVEFLLDVREAHTGPGHFQLDNVRIVPEVGAPFLSMLGAMSVVCRRSRSVKVKSPSDL